jgi:ABC-2 type transport system permease protein
MKKIIQIARLELSLLFYSPIAWLLIMILFLKMSSDLIPAIDEIQHIQQFIPAFSFLTDKLFTTSMRVGNLPFGIFFGILASLYLYTPLVTMGIISREISSGSIKLLYSSPVKLSQIVYGKFLAMLVYNFVIIALMGLFLLIGILCVDNFDYPHPLVALLVTYLLLSAYAAIGIFMSSLTAYQVVAAICTFAVLAFMNYIGNFGQSLDFVRDLTYSLSMPSRAERMVAGLLNSRDVIYYLVVSGIFLGFTIAKLQLDRVSKSFFYHAGRYILVLMIGLAVAYLSSRQPVIGYYDATQTKVNTIVKATQEILKRMPDEPLEVTAYINGLHGSYSYGAPVNRIPATARWEPYLRFKSNINLKWVYYYDYRDPQFYVMNQGKSLKTLFLERAKALDFDTAGFLNPELIRKEVDLRGENDRLVFRLKYKGKTTFLRTFDDANFWPDEPEISAAMKRLIVTPPKVVFATDGYQRSVDKVGDRDYKMLVNNKFSRSSMVNIGFDIDSVSLENSQIPAGIAALVISDPRVQFSPVALAKLQKYVVEGGNLLIAAEPGKQSIVNPLLDSLGVKMLNGTLVQSSRDFSYGLVTPILAAGAVVMAPGLKRSYKDKAKVSMPGAAALSEERKGPFTIQPLLMTNEKTAWIKKGQFVLDSAALVFDAKLGDQQGTFPSSLMLTRKVKNKEQRIVVAGDADFFSNKELARNNIEVVNGSFAISIFSWFAYEEFPVNMSRPDSRDKKLLLTKTGISTLEILYYGLIPGTILLLGMVLLIRRKRK